MNTRKKGNVDQQTLDTSQPYEQQTNLIHQSKNNVPIHQPPTSHTLQHPQEMSPPANAAAIHRILTDISISTTPLTTRSDQETYLENLTSTHKFTYYSSTYGHTIHDGTSLRKVLANIMRHHPNPEFGTASGNAAVDMLFEFGGEMLEKGYVEEVRRAAEGEVVETRVEEEEEGESEGNEESDEETALSAGRRLRKREKGLKRKASSASSESWQDFDVKQRRGEQTGAATSSPSGRETKLLKKRRRSDVGGIDARWCSPLGRDGAEAAVDHLQGYRSASALQQAERSGGGNAHATQVESGQASNAKLREAVERLNRRVHTAIVQLWDEVGGII